MEIVSTIFRVATPFLDAVASPGKTTSALIPLQLVGNKISEIPMMEVMRAQFAAVCDNKLFLSVQFHPESTPSPLGTEFLFDVFIEDCTASKENDDAKSVAHTNV